MVKQGERIYTTGDRCNAGGLGTVMHIDPATKYSGVNAWIKMDDGREFSIPAMMIGDVYAGNGLTRFVTLAAYEAWRKARMAERANA